MKQDAQLALAVHLPDDETFESYTGNTNLTVLKILRDFVSQLRFSNSHKTQNSTQPDLIETVNSFYLFGLSGAGKSHLLHAASNYADSLGKTSLCLPMSEIIEMPVEVLEGLEQIDLICVDDIQLIRGNMVWQQAIFDLFNRVKEQGKQILIAGTNSVQDLSLELPDLKSRLSWGYVEQLKQLTDDEKMAVVARRARQRGLNIQPDVIKYLLNHFSRDTAALIQYLDTLDKLSIREQRKITIPFIKEALANS
ncbi:DnaA regulatory inactivator Hda [Thalassotalea euphylliae]|uniref:DnaA regulatory inactivator Hda n=1 Tax=Thalassotalea euphylliae TaxID=1655234 RepID=A0A3E0TZH5_9GAMM|nr:DnaA regulatory inactivator Hda [Thalassotalea euphylliae]REL29385.1 DnaA regulatory inactivator Hda [Thalassotalea euphylliae]